MDEIKKDFIGILVAFDLDDTMYNERDFAASGYEAVCKLLDCNKKFRDQAAKAMRYALAQRKNPFEALECYCQKRHIPFPPIEVILNEYRYHSPVISLKLRFSTLLRRLKKQNIEMAIITDGRSRTQRAKIKALGLDKFIEDKNIFISEEIGFDKTSPEVWMLLEDKYPHAVARIYVGDNPAKDFIQPRLRGWHSIMLLDRNGVNIHPQQMYNCDTKPEWMVSDPIELERIIKDFIR